MRGVITSTYKKFYPGITFHKAFQIVGGHRGITRSRPMHTDDVIFKENGNTIALYIDGNGLYIL